MGKLQGGDLMFHLHHKCCSVREMFSCAILMGENLRIQKNIMIEQQLSLQATRSDDAHRIRLRDPAGIRARYGIWIIDFSKIKFRGEGELTSSICLSYEYETPT